MRIILSILIFTACIIALFALPVRFRKKLQRRIDNAISQSVYRQLSFLMVATGLAFGILLLFIRFIHGSLLLDVSDWLLAFINRGSSFASDGGFDGSEKTWAIIMGVVGIIFLGGTLISVISNIIERRVEMVKNGKVHYYFKNQIIIIGYDRMSIGLICQFAKDERYHNSDIVLQTTQEVPKVRHELFAKLESKIEKKVTIVSGNRTSVEDLERLHPELCKEIFILGEKDEHDNDALDVECIKKIHAILTKKSVSRIVRCNVLFENQTTFTVFQRQDIDHLKDRIDFVPFNYYEMWAQKVFVEGEYESLEKSGIAGKIKYTPLDRGGIDAESDKKVHLVVIGMSGMGVAMGIQAAHLCHFPNFVTKGIKTRITFIDENADREMNFLRGRYRHLFKEVDIYYQDYSDAGARKLEGANARKHEGAKARTNEENKNSQFLCTSLEDLHSQFSILNSQLNSFTDIEFEFIKARVENLAIQDYLSGLSSDSNTSLTVAICFSHPPQALATGLYLPDKLYYNNIPVLVWQETPYTTLDMLTKDGKYKNVKPFGMLENWYDLCRADDRIPMMVNYVYGKGVPETFPEEEIVAMWHNLLTAHKWSNRYYADSIKFKIRSFREFNPDEPLTDEQIALMSRVEHNRWNIEKLLMGYRPTTPLEKEAITKDLSKKTKFKKDLFAHNDICAYEDLQVDENGVCASEYDKRISAALPLIIRNDKRLSEYVRKRN